LFTWLPDVDPKSPCILKCRATADPKLVVAMDDKVADSMKLHFGQKIRPNFFLV
jgi:hypothetical protein